MKIHGKEEIMKLSCDWFMCLLISQEKFSLSVGLMTFHCIATLHQLLIDNNKKHDWVFINLGQQGNVSKAEVIAELESIVAMICKPT